MKKILIAILLLFGTTLHSQTFSGSTGGVSDDGLDNNFTAVVAGLTPPTLNGTHGLVTVCLDITHTYDSDLNIHIIAPDGTSITLFSGIGGGDDNFTNTCLDMSAAQSINAGLAPFTGIYIPTESFGDINNGQDGNGTWTLRIVDMAAQDVGYVNSWSVTFGAGAAVPFVFTSSNLPIVVINNNNVTIPDEPKIDATMGIIYNGVGMMNYMTDSFNNYNGRIGIEMRGAYSQSLPQKPYSIEIRDTANIQTNASILSMPAEHDFCLIANYNDKVFMRNTLAYQLFASMGHYASRTRFCEVVLNGRYQGIYIFCEKLKRDHHRVNIARLDSTENTGVNVTGGYILKNDYWDATNSWLLNYHPIDHPTFDVHLVYDYPKSTDITPAQQTYIQTFINDFETALYGPDYADTAIGYRKYMNINSFIDYLIVNEISRNNDGFKKSCYFFKDIDTLSQMSKLNAGPVWDFDWAFKDINECSIFAATDGSGWAYLVNDCNGDVNSPGWTVRFMQDTGFQNTFRCRWEYFRTNILHSDTLNNYIDSIATYLDSAQMRHFAKWGNLGANTGAPEIEPDPTIFAGEIQQFKDWLTRRITWLDANIPGIPNNCIPLTTAVVSGEVNPGISIYPNPTNSRITVVSSSSGGFIKIVDVLGRTILIHSIDSRTEQIDVSSLQSGVFTIELIETGKIIFKQKQIIIR